MYLTTNHLTMSPMLLFEVSWHKQEKNVSEGTIELMRNLHLKKAFLLVCCDWGGLHVKTRSHLLCSPAQGAAVFFDYPQLEYLGGVFGEILIWNPMGGTERVHPSVVELLAHETSLGVSSSSVSWRLRWGWWLPGELKQGLTLTKYINLGVAVTIWCQHASFLAKDTNTGLNR